MAQTICVLLDDAANSQLNALTDDPSPPLKYILRARLLLLSA